MKIPLCQCGCKQSVKWSRGHGWAQFVKGHNQRGKPSSRKVDPFTAPPCECGCANRVTGRRRGHWNRYLYGHAPKIEHHRPESIHKMQLAARARSAQVSEQNHLRVWTDESRLKLSESRLAMGECAANLVRGESNAMWRGGHRNTYHAEQKSSGFNQYQRRKVRERFIAERGHRCERCGRTDVKLELHHVDHDLFHNTDDNLKLVCRSCQMKFTAEFVKAQTS